MTDRHRSSIRWAFAGLGLSVVLIVIKLVGYLLTNSTAVLADALESSVHLVTSTFALYAVWLSAQPNDRNHPYGHGKVEYLSAGLEGALVAFTGFAVVAISTHRFLNPVALPEAPLGAAVELIAALLAFAGGTALARAGRRNDSPTIEADGIHIRSDALTSFAGFLGVGLVAVTGHVWIDSLAALLLGFYLVYAGFGVVRNAIGGLMDEAKPALLERIVTLLEETREPGWLTPHAMKVHRLGQSFHFDLHIVFPRYWELSRAHDACHRITDALQAEFGERTESMIHAEPCTDGHCPRCDVEDCPIRKAPRTIDRVWTVETIAERHSPVSGYASTTAPTRRETSG